ncbi:hypothetical protein [Mesorhizobium sp. M7A.F.Ca.MR.362.00.0.0]|uniref:hypothetical protein n=1 Tax=Mesorhizobium sp. M7A.F.Ca.MR.362.00.0.0 TaxID=2496779 RepID=UPI000FD54463|nr:hypothetical protein [Mesorhizobium sp. M7A.F.Ca.MR.362.00.0.0]RUU82759.1 hypothetical protein EOC06_02930 [Mesorhizobium sp. M7A.F.Ca.MR.362.00.0.0]RWN96587.1 MAG: hypothetical protein EOS05_01195 [Mesorhizobium sp.]
MLQSVRECKPGRFDVTQEALDHFVSELEAARVQAATFYAEAQFVKLLGEAEALPVAPTSVAALNELMRLREQARSLSRQVRDSSVSNRLELVIKKKLRAIEAAGMQPLQENATSAEHGANEPIGDVSSFRGIELGMTEAQLTQALDRSFTLTSTPAGTETQALTTLFESMNGQPKPSLFIVKGQQACGQIVMHGGRAARLRLYQCYFDIGDGMSIGDFAQQITETYELEDGMSGHWEMRGDGAYQFKYTEYVGIRQATSERFTASLHQMDNNLTLTVEGVPQANFK